MSTRSDSLATQSSDSAFGKHSAPIAGTAATADGLRATLTAATHEPSVYTGDNTLEELCQLVSEYLGYYRGPERDRRLLLLRAFLDEQGLQRWTFPDPTFVDGHERSVDDGTQEVDLASYHRLASSTFGPAGLHAMPPSFRLDKPCRSTRTTPTAARRPNAPSPLRKFHTPPRQSPLKNVAKCNYVVPGDVSPTRNTAKPSAATIPAPLLSAACESMNTDCDHARGDEAHRETRATDIPAMPHGAHLVDAAYPKLHFCPAPPCKSAPIANTVAPALSVPDPPRLVDCSSARTANPRLAKRRISPIPPELGSCEPSKQSKKFRFADVVVVDSLPPHRPPNAWHWASPNLDEHMQQALSHARKALGDAATSRQKENVDDQFSFFANKVLGSENTLRLTKLAMEYLDRSAYMTPPASPTPCSESLLQQELNTVLQSPLSKTPAKDSFAFPSISPDTFQLIRRSFVSYVMVSSNCATEFCPHRTIIGAVILYYHFLHYTATSELEQAIMIANLAEFNRLYDLLYQDVQQKGPAYSKTQEYLLRLKFELSKGRTWVTLLRDCFLRIVTGLEDVSGASQQRTCLKNQIALSHNLCVIDRCFGKGMFYLMPINCLYQYVPANPFTRFAFSSKLCRRVENRKVAYIAQHRDLLICPAFRIGT